MAKETTRGGKLIGKTIGYGLATAALYAAVFMNSDTIMNLFTKGGWYAALPVSTVFLFSYVHGTFSPTMSGKSWESERHKRLPSRSPRRPCVRFAVSGPVLA